MVVCRGRGGCVGVTCVGGCVGGCACGGSVFVVCLCTSVVCMWCCVQWVGSVVYTVWYMPVCGCYMCAWLGGGRTDVKIDCPSDYHQ